MQGKACERCGGEFVRPRGLSDSQWMNRRFCSRSCGATKISVPESAIVKMYVDDQMSSTEISKETGISTVHILRLLSKNGARKRSLSEGKKLALSKPEVRERMALSSRGRSLSEKAKDKLRARTGNNNANWRNGITINNNGYLIFTRSTKNGDNAGKFLHTVLAEWLYGRKLTKGEGVHHIDGDRLNNNPCNLCILSASEHARIHELWSAK